MAKWKTLEEWIREAMSDEDKTGKLSALVLVHKIGQSDEELHRTVFGGKEWLPKDLASMFQNKAEAYAQALPGVQTFNLLGFYGGSNTPEARHPFIVNTAPEFHGLGTEGPDERGMRQQGMRLTEAIVQNTFRQIGGMQQASLGMIEMLTRQNATLMHENREAFNMMKELLIERDNKAFERDMQLKQYERSTAERRKWLSFGPALVNQICGREIFPQSTVDTALVETIAESLDNDSLAKLQGVIPSELMGPLAHRMAQYVEEKNKEREVAQSVAMSKVAVNGSGGVA